MIGTAILLATLILVCAIGFIVIYQKLDKKPTPDIKLTVNVPPQETKVYNIQDSKIPTDNLKIQNPFDEHFRTNPMDYINKTQTKAHIKWQGTPEQKNPGSTIS